VTVVLAAILCLSCAIARAASAEAVSQPAIGSAAPDFSRKDLAGEEVSLASLRGDVVVLNFWATWCSPCLGELPRFAGWQRTYRARGFRIIGISIDDEEAPVRAAYAKFGLTYPVVMGDSRLAELYGGVYGLPVTLLVDRSGTIRFRHRGETDLAIVEREIRTLLSDGSPQ
jgi:peroxiredoxin